MKRNIRGVPKSLYADFYVKKQVIYLTKYERKVLLKMMIWLSIVYIFYIMTSTSFLVSFFLLLLLLLKPISEPKLCPAIGQSSRKVPHMVPQYIWTFFFSIKIYVTQCLSFIFLSYSCTHNHIAFSAAFNGPAGGDLGEEYPISWISHRL